MLPENEQGNRNISAFSLALQAGKTRKEKLLSLTEDVDTVFLIADDEKNIVILHSPHNFGGTRTRPTNKVAAMIGLGLTPIGVLINKKAALDDCKLVTPTIDEFELCATGINIAALACPAQSGQVTFPGSATFIPAPWLRESILNSETLDPFELIKIAMADAKDFDDTHKDETDFDGKAINHAEDFSLWAFGVGKGLIKETRFRVNPDNKELKTYCNERQRD